MKRQYLTLVLSLLVCSFILGCSLSEIVIRDQLNRVIIGKIQKVAVIKLTETQYLYKLFSNEEINITKKEMKQIKNIEKLDVDPLNSFKGFRLLYLYLDNPKRTVNVLYSIDTKEMMLKESDVFPEKQKMLQEVTVYKFIIPEKVIDILKNHEQELPNEGVFLNSWPFTAY